MITVLIQMNVNDDPLIIAADEVATCRGVRFAERTSVTSEGKLQVLRWRLKHDSFPPTVKSATLHDQLDSWPIAYKVLAGGVEVEGWDDLSGVDLYELEGQANQ